MFVCVGGWVGACVRARVCVCVRVCGGGWVGGGRCLMTHLCTLISCILMS